MFSGLLSPPLHRKRSDRASHQNATAQGSVPGDVTVRPAAADVRSCVRALCFPVYALNRRGAESVAGALRAWAYLLAAFCDDCLCSSWNHVEQAPADPILGVAAAFKADPVHLHPISSRPFRHARTLFSPSCAMHPHPLDFRPLLSQPPPPPPPPPPRTLSSPRSPWPPTLASH